MDERDDPDVDLSAIQGIAIAIIHVPWKQLWYNAR